MRGTPAQTTAPESGNLGLFVPLVYAFSGGNSESNGAGMNAIRRAAPVLHPEDDRQIKISMPENASQATLEAMIGALASSFYSRDGLTNGHLVRRRAAPPIIGLLKGPSSPS